MCCAASSSSASTASSPRADAVDRLGRPSGALHPGSRFAAQGVLRGIDHAGAGAAAAAQGAGGDRLLQLLGPVRDRPAGHRVASRGARPAARLGGAASAVRRPGGRSGRGGGAADLPPGGGPHRERAPAPAVAGDSPEERALLLARARTQIAFYGSTRNYAFHFDDLGSEGTSARLNDRMQASVVAAMAGLGTDEMLERFAVNVAGSCGHGQCCSGPLREDGTAPGDVPGGDLHRREPEGARTLGGGGSRRCAPREPPRPFTAPWHNFVSGAGRRRAPPGRAPAQRLAPGSGAPTRRRSMSSSSSRPWISSWQSTV